MKRGEIKLSTQCIRTLAEQIKNIQNPNPNQINTKIEKAKKLAGIIIQHCDDIDGELEN